MASSLVTTSPSDSLPARVAAQTGVLVGLVRPTRAAAAPRGAAIPRASAAIAGEFKIKRGGSAADSALRPRCAVMPPYFIHHTFS